MVKILLESSGLAQENQEPVAVCLNTVSIKEQINMLNDLPTASKCFIIDGTRKDRQQSIGYPR